MKNKTIMKHKTMALFVMLCCGGIAAAADQGPAAHWTYEGDEGPARWGALDAKYSTCDSGRNQSPVALGEFIDADLPPIAFDYRGGGGHITTNGHGVQVDIPQGSRITVDGTDFALKQFHFHTPSEHTIDGRSFPMEIHFVHADAQGNLAVVGVMVEAGNENAAIDAVVRGKANDDAHLSSAMAASSLLPDDRDYYRYSGSLTTPPCTEGVRWFVMKESVEASSAQITRMATDIGQANNRPVMPAGARSFLE